MAFFGPMMDKEKIIRKLRRRMPLFVVAKNKNEAVKTYKLMHLSELVQVSQERGESTNNHISVSAIHDLR